MSAQTRSSEPVRLARADADLVRRDELLPGLATLLDPAAFLEALSRDLPDANPVAAEPLYLRYKPGTNCLVEYRVRAAGGREALLYAKTYGLDAASKLKKALRKPGVPGAFGVGRLVWEDRKTVVSFFPNDDRLEQLRGLTDEGKTRRLLGHVLPECPELREGRLAALRYKPERRYVARLTGTGGQGAALKLYTPGGYAQAERNALAFSETFKSTGPLRVARVLGRAEREGAIAFEWADGEPFEKTPTAGAAEKVGAALAELHAQGTRDLKYTTRQEEISSLNALAGAVSYTLPELLDGFYTLAARLSAQLLRERPLAVPIHGDFYDEQVLISASHVTILDLDRATLGDPATDLGNFAARLEYDALEGDLPGDLAANLEASLIAGYGGAGGDVLPEKVRLYKAVGLFRLAPEPFRSRRDGWAEKTGRILSRAAEVLEEGA
ncbi:Phosphotransferase enzyme family [Rubrobacter radiotolerans]|uniref:Aminoglycoside phosphotransferase family protein n=1 Tax=Rubrobacter radiotolerans TaxID=42256 RepID=A0A023X7H3_RUBRA|nr:aminoglycoside phosphotransferase family protein [Rubrobacter radiotolerans]AHY47985.1 Phosphotransferase enzyme family [Rubrobacter radiotolerans]MDX5892624.1 aminoglycoside phosphotransferase family protein [Rubrobacter radiotolerans]SMC07948.1 Predicted kinase, aminoglycoside phosphotransferase (APT) family [Rubrobacter radiotolerans DSM 5868]